MSPHKGRRRSPIASAGASNAGRGQEYLVGGGEMGERIRAFDWSRTPLGPIDGWSPALRTMVGILLANRFPLLLWWGPQYVSIYNDSYRPVLGTKHPRALGQPASECWKEIWHILQPLIDTPFSGGPATWNDDLSLEINRLGFTEETHFTVAYSPVPDETVPGGIGGVLATVHEITDKVVGNRRVMLLRDLAAQSSEAKSAEEACAIAARTLAMYPKDIPFALLYLVTPDRKTASLAGTAGVGTGTGASPATISLRGNEASASPWPLAAAMRSEAVETVTDLASSLGGRVPPGPWGDPPHTALVVPIHSNKAHHLAAFLVAGISAGLQLDDSYRGFLNLVSSQIATSIANARGYEEERKRAEALAEIDRAKTAFFSNVSHEFRTPLTLMLGPIEDLLSRGDSGLPPEAAVQLEVTHRNGLRLLRLVNALLDFSRIQAGRTRAVFEPVDLAAVTADLASVFRAATDRAGLKLTVDCPPVGEPVYVDLEMWEKIVLNLVSNAFKFTFEGEIAVTLRAVGGGAELRVSDTGVGIPAEEMPRLFERFHRVPNTRSRTHEGSGIGLALVQELVKLHNGSIHVESRLDEGTAFIVKVPLGKGHVPPGQVGGASILGSASPGAAPFVEEAMRWVPDDAATADAGLLPRQEWLPMPCPASEADNSRLLVADDNADMRQYLARLLGERYQVETVPDGRTALKAARDRRPDLILTDVMMPGLDGIGLLRELRADAALRTIPVILLSARAGEESRIEGLHEGADDYLIKPFSARELLARVAAHLQMARLRRQAEAAVRESEERFRCFVTAGSDAVYCMSPDWKEMRYLRGREFIPDTDSPNTTWLDRYVHPEDQPLMVAAINEAVGTGSAFEVDHRVRRVDGTLGCIRSRAVPLRDSQGQIVEWIGAARDITARQKTEEALEESRAKYKSLIETTSDFIWEVDASGRYTYCSPQMETLWGIRPGEMVGKTPFENVPPGAREEGMRFFQGALESRSPFRGIQVSSLDGGGNLITIEMSGVPFFDAEGELSGFRGVTRDITERKKAEESLRESEARFRTLSEASPVGVGVSSADGVLVYTSPAYERILGYGCGELLGVMASHLYFNEADRTSWLGAMKDSGVVQGFETRLKKKDGTPIWVSISASPVLYEGRQAVVGTIQDITDRKRAEEELKRRTEDLQAANSELEAFSYSVSHDLRAPLRRLDGFSDILLLDYADRLDDTGREHLKRIRDASQTMSQLIDDMLRLSRIGRAELHITRVDLSRMAATIADELQAAGPDHRAEFVVAPGVNAVGDWHLLQILMRNLMENSWRYTSDCRDPSIQFGTTSRGERQVYFVKDNGIGFDMKYADKLFKPFQRLHTSRKYSGTGIGLAIAERVVQRHGGRIWAEAESGKGATFYFTLGSA